MDQDFHYYGTYYAARVGGNYSQEDATLIAKASNFIDFLSNERYAGYWHIVGNTEKSLDQHYDVIAEVEYPRYTYQGNLSSGLDAESGLWSSFHFLPGNYNAPPDTPTKIDVHGESVAKLLPEHQVRVINPDSSLKKINPDIGKLLNRPQSALSRALIQDTINCLNNSKRLEQIIERAASGKVLLEKQNKVDILKRLGLLLLGARSHVIADTWAHQDWSGVNNVINTYCFLVFTLWFVELDLTAFHINLSGSQPRTTPKSKAISPSYYTYCFIYVAGWRRCWVSGVSILQKWARGY